MLLFLPSRFSAATAALAPAAPSFALDSLTSGLDAAWSVSRRMLTSYNGSLIRVRRSSDSTESDIGCDASGNLDTAALLAFTGAGSGFVVTIYSQSGTKHLTQATAAMQPRIVNGGVIDVVGANNRPAAVTMTANTQVMRTASFTAVTSSSLTMNAVIYAPSSATRLFCGTSAGGADAGAGGWLPAYLSSTTKLASYNVSDRASFTVSLPLLMAYSSLTTPTGHTLRLNGSVNSSAFTTTAKSLDQYILFSYSALVNLSAAGLKFSEGAVWSANADSGMAALIAAQQTYFG